MTSDRPHVDDAAGGPLVGPEAALSAVLAAAHVLPPHELPRLAREHAAAFGARDAALFLTDMQQAVMYPFRPIDEPVDPEFAEPLLVESTLPGRAFQHSRPYVQHRSGSTVVVWIPLLDGTERLGVLGLVVEPDGLDDAELISGEVGERLRTYASLLAQLVVTKTAFGDSIPRLRRQRTMDLAAELQWSLLPPLTFTCPDLTVAAALEPAYEVAGDTVDYAVDPGIARLAVFDGIGHGLGSAQMAAMAIAAYRHARRLNYDLIETTGHIEAALQQTFPDAAFSTALLTELDTDTGLLRWVNAGHPEPLLLRNGRLVKFLHVAPRPPLGVHFADTPAASAATEVGTEHLEPGDVVLFYTDGVTEARTADGEFFGEQRLVDLIVRHLAAGLPPPETIRRTVRELLAHQEGRLTDDATLVLVQWPSEENSLSTV